MKSQEHANWRYINDRKMLPLMPYCALAFRWMGCRVMADCHVQLVQNSLIRIQNLKLSIPSTSHYPIEQLTNLNCSLNHMAKTNHHLNIAGVFYCYRPYGIIMNTKRFSPLSAGLFRVNWEGKTLTGKTSAFKASFTHSSWFLRNGMTGRRKKPQVDG